MRTKDNELVSIQDLAQDWGVSRDTIERLMRNNELEVVRIGTRRRITRQSAREYVERNRA